MFSDRLLAHQYASEWNHTKTATIPNSAKRKSTNQELNDDQKKIKELELRIVRLLEAGRQVITQRDAAQLERDDARRNFKVAEIAIRKLKGELEAFADKNQTNPGSSQAEGRFRRVKAAFAARYHPDKVLGAGFDRMVREEVFKEFWAEIEKIERGS